MNIAQASVLTALHALFLFVSGLEAKARDHSEVPWMTYRCQG